LRQRSCSSSSHSGIGGREKKDELFEVPLEKVAAGLRLLTIRVHKLRGTGITEGNSLTENILLRLMCRSII
jgi:hypothetical protein